MWGPVDADIATCLDTGLMTDTGHFIFKGTDEHTFALFWGTGARQRRSLDRKLYRAMDQLERLQRWRRGENVPPLLDISLGGRK